MWPSVVFAAALCVMAYLVNKSGKVALQQTAAVLIIVWLVLLGTRYATGHANLWYINAIVDFVAGCVVLTQPGARQFPHSLIGVVFMMQLVTHLVYGAAFDGGGVAVKNLYLSMLTVGGGLQIVTLIMGAIYGTGGKVHRAFDWLGGAKYSGTSGFSRMEKGE